jgi:hypothetical protein
MPAIMLRPAQPPSAHQELARRWKYVTGTTAGRLDKSFAAPAQHLRVAGRRAMDEDERWRRASEWADRFSPFRRRQPIFVGLVFALVALITLGIFLSLVGLKLGQVWIEALATIAAVMLVGAGLALLSNREARATFIAEYRRLNKVNPAPDHKERAKRSALP